MNIPYTFPPQHQDKKPGIESIMIPKPISDDPSYIGSGKLNNKIAIITGGDSGIGRAVSIAYAKEGADLTIVYLSEREDGDAQETKNIVEKYGRKALLIRGDLSKEDFCKKVVDETMKTYGKIDILVNNCATAYLDPDITKLSNNELLDIFGTNVFSYFYMASHAVKHMKSGSSIINTCSILAFEPFEKLIAYSASKGAVVSFTKSLAKQLAPKGIRVNAVAPTYTWTPLIPSTYSNEEDVVSLGKYATMGRAAQPFEISPTFVFLASNVCAGYLTGEVIMFN
ncbi:MAG: SDR family oxidoreductase [Clostridia bacterium]|nr:SDR family oxidoreductase [Clostridia bacterium]